MATQAGDAGEEKTQLGIARTGEEACSPWTDWRKEKADQVNRQVLGAAITLPLKYTTVLHRQSWFSVLWRGVQPLMEARS